MSDKWLDNWMKNKEGLMEGIRVVPKPDIPDCCLVCKFRHEYVHHMSDIDEFFTQCRHPDNKFTGELYRVLCCCDKFERKNDGQS